MNKYFVSCLSVVFFTLAAVDAAIPQHNLERKNNNNKGTEEFIVCE